MSTDAGAVRRGLAEHVLAYREGKPRSDHELAVFVERHAGTLLAIATVAGLSAARPRIVCLCGSTRFWKTFQRVGLEETLAGRIVLSIGAASGTDDEHFGNLTPEAYDRVKGDLDRLHLQKIELADEVLILNVGGYIGPSTDQELDHARALGKTVRWLEAPADAGDIVPRELTEEQIATTGLVDPT